MAKKPAEAIRLEEDAIVRGDHSNPFSFLGPHAVKDGLIIRTFQPWARRVWVIDQDGREITELEMRHDGGLFCATMPSRTERFAYRLRREFGDGHKDDIDDPYRFPAWLGEMDMYLLGEGNHLRSYDKMGAHVIAHEGVYGTNFAVWAPNAKRVSVVGDFNGWDGRLHPMRLHPGVGVWEIFIPGVGQGAAYKFELLDRNGHMLPLKADPYGFYAEVPPKTASVVYDLKAYEWHDAEWMHDRAHRHERAAPLSIYEVHLESWRRKEGNQFLSYGELAEQLGHYAREMGFTHVELLPVHEHPFSGSWGYQPIGLYAPTSRFGTPDDFRQFVDKLHQMGVGVIIDWVAGHFPSDAHGLHLFDGTHLYEHSDPRQGEHKDWNTLIYNYGRNEVCNYLTSNALFWCDKFHIDGLRVDAVASMLYLDYSRKADEWIPNRYGGNENLEAIDFLRRTNTLVYQEFPGAMTIAEESTSWPMVSRPVHLGGLGFGYKWNMGWMHDTLRYMSKEPIHRRYHHDDLTFGLLYAFHENFVLPLSHDEVVHGKGSILGRMTGDHWQRFANLRAYYGFMWTQPGKKLLFMGQEFGQESEWNYNHSIDWHLLRNEQNEGVRLLVRDLNKLYRDEPALHQLDNEPGGFQWVDANDRDNSVIAWVRYARDPDDFLIVVSNFTPVVRDGYRIGVPRGGWYAERINTDSTFYGGSDVHQGGGVMADDQPWHAFQHSISVRLPPLATLILKPQR